MSNERDRTVDAWLASGNAILRTVAFLAAVAFIVQTGLHWANLTWFELKIDAFNADKDGSVFSWASIVATGIAAFVAFLLAFVARSRLLESGVLAGLLAFLSLDDFIEIHERVSDLMSQLVPGSHLARLFWPMAFAPLLLATFVLLWRASALGGLREQRFMRAGLLALAIAVALEFTSPLLFAAGFGHGDLPYELEVVVEEGLELVGWMLIAGGLSVVVLGLSARSSVQHPDGSVTARAAAVDE